MHTTLRNHHLTARRSLAALSTAAALTLGLVTGPTPAAQAVPVDGSVTTTDTNTAPDTSGVTPLYRAPRHRLVTTRDKLKVSVYEYGPSARTAETIVMTGGWPWNSSGMEPFAQVLATKFHVVRYDQRGSGQSSHPEDSNLYTMERLADEMLDVIHATTLPRQKVHVFGEAWCPFIAAQLTWQMGKKSPIATPPPPLIWPPTSTITPCSPAPPRRKCRPGSSMPPSATFGSFTPTQTYSKNMW